VRQLELAGKRRHAVPVGAGIVAPVGELVALRRQLFGQRVLAWPSASRAASCAAET
jgi:hypothetical protein